MDKKPNSELMDALAAAFAKNVALHGTFDADDGHVYVDVKPDENAFVALDGSFSLQGGKRLMASFTYYKTVRNDTLRAVALEYYRDASLAAAIAQDSDVTAAVDEALPEGVYLKLRNYGVLFDV